MAGKLAPMNLFEPVTEKCLILVCGSRALSTSKAAKAFVWRHMLALLEPLPRPSLIIHGDCEGSPDVWTKHACLKLAVPPVGDAPAIPGHAWVGYQLPTGLRVTSEGKTAPWTKSRNGWSHLDRNFALALRAQAAKQDGYRVLIVGYVADWSASHGTDETLEMTAGLGLEPERVLITAEFLRQQDRKTPPSSAAQAPTTAEAAASAPSSADAAAAAPPAPPPGADGASPAASPPSASPG